MFKQLHMYSPLCAEKEVWSFCSRQGLEAAEKSPDPSFYLSVLTAGEFRKLIVKLHKYLK